MGHVLVKQRPSLYKLSEPGHQPRRPPARAVLQRFHRRCAPGTFKDKFFESVPPDTLPFPDLASEYENFKELAVASDRYFTTKPGDSNIYYHGEPIDMYDMFVSTDPDAPYELMFIDTTDGNPPAADGSNLTSVALSGQNQNDDRMKGVYYINANFTVSGIGAPPSLTTVSPLTDEYVTIPQIFLDGAIYAAGTLDMAGNAGVFGAIVAERGFVGGGTPDVWYNVKLGDGIELGNGNIGGPFNIVIHNNFAPQPWEDYLGM
jgi:hypothetical protein